MCRIREKITENQECQTMCRDKKDIITTTLMGSQNNRLGIITVGL